MPHAERAARFQSLIGTGKTWWLTRSSLATLVVSIPHRYGQNYFLLETTGRPERVSIPHRYGQNLFQHADRPSGHEVSIPHRYGQNSSCNSSRSSSSSRFQSLIGTGKTRAPGRARLRGRAQRVSIPHRYGQNTDDVFASAVTINSFNPS